MPCCVICTVAEQNINPSQDIRISLHETRFVHAHSVVTMLVDKVSLINDPFC